MSKELNLRKINRLVVILIIVELILLCCLWIYFGFREGGVVYNFVDNAITWFIEHVVGLFEKIMTSLTSML